MVGRGMNGSGSWMGSSGVSAVTGMRAAPPRARPVDRTTPTAAAAAISGVIDGSEASARARIRHVGEGFQRADDADTGRRDAGDDLTGDRGHRFSRPRG